MRLQEDAALGFMLDMRNQSIRPPGRKAQWPQPPRGYKNEEQVASACLFGGILMCLHAAVFIKPVLLRRM